MNNLNISERVVIEKTNKDIYEGYFRCQTKDYIVLDEAFQHSDRTSVESWVRISKNDISSLKKISVPEEEDAEPKEKEKKNLIKNMVVKKGTVTTDSTKDEIKSDKTLNEPVSNTSTDHESSLNGTENLLGNLANVTENHTYERYKCKAKSYTYISKIDKEFLETINELTYCDSISIFGLGGNLGRCLKLSILAIATKENVFLFDVKLCGEEGFEKGLKELLESEEIEKIVFNCKELTDCLKHNHNVELNNVFDLQVADYLVLKRQGRECNLMRKLSECISDYFDMPSFTISNTTASLKNLIARPMSDYLLCATGLSVVYLKDMKKKILKNLIPNLYKATEYQAAFLSRMTECNMDILSLNLNIVPETLKENIE